MIPKLTGLAAEIATVIGEERALRLLMRRGGTEIKLPGSAPGSLLADLVGEEAAEAMIAHFGGTQKMSLPCGHLRGAPGRRAMGVAMLRRGASAQDVALSCDVSVRTVYDWRATLAGQGLLPRPDGATQLDLFKGS